MKLSKYTLILLSASLAMLMVKLDAYIVNISLPTIAQNFNCSRDMVSMVLLAYLVASTSTLLLFGTLGDRLGLKKIFILGFVFFTIGSLLCGLSRGMAFLIIARFIQGHGGSMLVANCMAIVGRFMPHESVGRSYGILITISAVGVSLGAPLGGVITFYLSWHWIFLINIPVGLIAIWGTHRYVPSEEKLPFSFHEFDFSGTFLALMAFTCLILAFNSFDNKGPTAIIPYFILILAALFFVFFILRERHAINPILDLSLFRIKPLVVALVASLLVWTANFGNSYMMPFYLEHDLGFTPNWVGFFILITSGMIMIISPLSGKMSDRINPLKLSMVAMALGVFGYLFFCFSIPRFDIWLTVIFLFLGGIMIGLFASPNNKMIMEMAVEGKQGIVSATTNTFSSMAAVLGVSVFQMIYSVTTGGDSAHPTIAENAAGFHNAYFAGVLLVLAALILSWSYRKQKKN